MAVTSSDCSLGDVSFSSLIRGAALADFDTTLPDLDAGLADLDPSLVDFEPSLSDLDPETSPSVALTDFSINTLLAKADVESSIEASEADECPVDYSQQEPPQSPAPYQADMYEAPLSPCVTESPQKLSCSTSDSGYLTSPGSVSPPSFSLCTSPTTVAAQPSSQPALTLDAPSAAALDYLHTQWSEQPAPSSTERPSDSYTTMIGRALMSVPERELVLGDIYAFILQHYPYFKTATHSWRSTIRHNLSTMPCFVRGRKARTGRSFYWGVHPDFVANFEQGYFSRRQAQQAQQQGKTPRPLAQPTAVRAPAAPSPLTSSLQPQPTMTSTPSLETRRQNRRQQRASRQPHVAQATAPVISAQERFEAMQASCAKLLGYNTNIYINHAVTNDFRR